MRYKMLENQRPRVLYVDNEESSLIIFKAYFENYYDIDIATSGAEGLRILQTKEIDVIITDQGMPCMTGIAFLEQIPEHILAIHMVLTGYSDVATMMDAINLGKIYRYISKPWDFDELKTIIDKAVETLVLKRNNLALVEQLKQANELLEQRVQERTIDLQKALHQINEQKRELEELNATKDKFFSIVAHDIRNPLSSLSGFSHLLSEYSEKMTHKEIIELSKELNIETKNTLRLVDNLLTWANHQMKQISYHPELIDINTLVKESVAQLKSSANRKAITIEMSLFPDLMVSADVNHLRLILLNLLTNAVKFTASGGKINITATYNVTSEIEIRISDSGVGMSQEQVKNLFKIDRSKSTSGTAGEKGTELGLILCKEFIERNGGEIAVSSKKGKGTTFVICLQPCLAEVALMTNV